MNINSIQALRGANYWSIQFPKLIQLRIEIEDEDLIDVGILNTIQQVVNIKANTELSPKYKLAELIGKLALQLQQSAGASVSFLSCHSTKYPQFFNIVFEYETENSGKEAGKAAVKILRSIIANSTIDLNTDILYIKKLFTKEMPSEQLAFLIQQAQQLTIPIIQASNEGQFQFGYGIHGVYMDLNQLPKSLDQYFEPGENGRIPIIAVTGSNGKTTTTRLIAHLIQTSKKTVGFTTSDGIYIAGKMVDEGDTTGPISAEVVLRNNQVEVAVLETARGGIVRAGLGFDICDIAVVTNVQDDHLGISDIETMEDLAKVKSVIVQAVKTNGFAVLNADNAYTIAMGQKAICKVAWFSMDAQNPILVDAHAKGNPIAYIQNDAISIQTQTETFAIAHLKDVPITFNGTLHFMVQNVLAASLASFLYGLDKQTIALGLSCFYPSAEQTPGRMNIFDLNYCKVMVDFAHNPDGFAGIRDFMATIQSPNKIGIIVGTGDRKEEDVRELGRLSATMFDHILIHQVKFLRGKTAENLVELLVEGMHAHNPTITWERVPDEIEPLGYALSIARKDSFITALSDVLNNPTQLIATYKDNMAGAE